MGFTTKAQVRLPNFSEGKNNKSPLNNEVIDDVCYWVVI